MTDVIKVPLIKATQPLGDLYVGSLPSRVLWKITEYDMRQIQLKEDNIYVATGVQRKINEKRVSEIAEYVKTVDATFPTAVVLAVSSDDLEIDQKKLIGKLRIFSEQEAYEAQEGSELFQYLRVARVIDGQHRIEGLKRAGVEDFDVNIAFIIDASMEDQARVFSIVNLAQTKVSKSLVYDLFSYGTSNSPEKIAHSVCISLDKTEESPFYQRIKRLGTATPGRQKPEPLTQATVVEGLLSHIVASKEQLIRDRDRARRGKAIDLPDAQEAERLVLRPFYAEERDVDMAELIWNYFDAVRTVWPNQWELGGKGKILPRTNGFRALIRFFHDAYNHVGVPGDVVPSNAFVPIFRKVEHLGDQFDTDNYPPGTSGESGLYADLKKALPE